MLAPPTFLPYLIALPLLPASLLKDSNAEGGVYSLHVQQNASFVEDLRHTKKY